MSDIGRCLYSSDRVHGGSGEPLGGVIVGWDREAITTIDWRRTRPNLRIDRIKDDEQGTWEESPTQRLRILVRRLCEEVAYDGFKRRQGAMSEREGQCVLWAAALLRAMGGPS